MYARCHIETVLISLKVAASGKKAFFWVKTKSFTCLLLRRNNCKVFLSSSAIEFTDGSTVIVHSFELLNYEEKQ